MKIAIVMPLAEQRGGGELALLHLLQQGSGQGVDWLILFLEDGPMVQQARDLGAEVAVVPSGRLREPHKMIAAILRISRICKQQGVSVLMGWFAIAYLYAAPAAMLAGIPSLWYQVSTPYDKNFVDRIATLMPGLGVITNSKACHAGQMALPPGRTGPIVYHGVELERFNPDILPSPRSARETLGLPQDVPLIGIVGRLQRWKGIHTFLSAMPLVLAKYPDAHFVVVGGEHALEPDYSPFLTRQIESLKLQPYLTMAGLQKNVPLWMQALDVFVHASKAEPFGIVIIEAMALGKPVIAGDEGGPLEIITDGVDGLLTHYDDVDALANAIIRYLDDAEFAARIGAAGRLRAQQFSTKRFATEMIAGIKKLSGRQ